LGPFALLGLGLVVTVCCFRFRLTLFLMLFKRTVPVAIIIKIETINLVKFLALGTLLIFFGALLCPSKEALPFAIAPIIFKKLFDALGVFDAPWAVFDGLLGVGQCVFAIASKCVKNFSNSKTYKLHFAKSFHPTSSYIAYIAYILYAFCKGLLKKSCSQYESVIYLLSIHFYKKLTKAMTNTNNLNSIPAGYLKVIKAAKKNGLSKTRLYALIKQGQVRTAFIQQGGKVIYVVEDASLKKYLSSSMERQNTAPIVKSDKDFLSVADAAKAVERSKSYIYYLIKTGSLSYKACRLNRQRQPIGFLVNKKDLFNFFKE
jgi:predicted DNA-binding transcriptional regulator AlpA